LSPEGLAWRLQRGTLRGWAIAIVIMGVTVGFVSEEFKGLFQDNPEVAKALGQVGGSANFTDLFFAAMMGFMAVAMGGYVVQALLRMRSEESAGHLEPVLATHVSRARWMLSHIGTVTFGIVLLILLFGATSGLTYVLITNSAWSEMFKVIKAAAVHLPALLAFAGFVIATFAVLPRWSVAVSWAGFAVSYLLMQFGLLLKLPQKLLDISPFAHTPAVPLEEFQLKPLVFLLGIAALLVAGGLIAFRRRNLTTS
jgi:ABC-2 type transport system permease protein